MITYSPVEPYELPIVWGWLNEFRNCFADDVVPATFEAWLSTWDQRILRGIRVDDQLAGCIAIEPVYSLRMVTAHCVFGKRFWGRKITQLAVQDIANELFSQEITKISMVILADNHLMRGLLKRIGGFHEGTLRRHTLRGGVPADIEVWALFPPGESWAQPSNQSPASQEVSSAALEAQPEPALEPPATTTVQRRRASKTKRPARSVKR